MWKLYYPQEKDYDLLTTLWEKSVRATHTFLSEEDIAFFKPLVRNEYLKSVELVCAIDEKKAIVAFMGISDQHLEMLFVAPEKRGLGVGKFLIAHAIKNMNVNSVDVNEQNEQAVNFYLHIGFEISSRDDLDGMGKPFPILHLKLNNCKFQL